jgi:thioredoxin 1
MSITVSDQTFDSEVINCKGFVLVDFWAEWCRPCQNLMPEVERLAENRRDKIKVCKFNIDGNTEVPTKYGIQAIPTLIIFKDGEEIDRKTGFIDNLPEWVDILLV